MNTLSDVTGFSPVELKMGDDSLSANLLKPPERVDKILRACARVRKRREEEEREEAMVSEMGNEYEGRVSASRISSAAHGITCKISEPV